MTAHNGELDIQGGVYSSGGVAGGEITLSGSTVTIGADGFVAANGGSGGGNIDIRARDGLLAIDGRVSNAVYEGSGSGNVGMRLIGSAVRIGPEALLDTSRNGTGQLVIGAREGSLDFSGTVMALDSAGEGSRGSVGMSGTSIRLLDGSSINTNRLVFFTGVSESAPLVNTLTMQGSTVLAGSRGIHMFASDVNLSGSTLSSESGPIEIESDRMTLNHATLASNASGTTIRLETRDFSNTNSQLSASAGRWLVYLKKDGRFDADAFSDLDYRFVQVDAIRNGEWETPVLSGVGQNGVLMADPLIPKLKLVVRDYDGTPDANFRDVLSHDLPDGFDVRRSGDWTFAQGEFENKNVGTDKRITLGGNASLFKIQTSKGIDVYGAQPYYVGDIEQRPVTVGDLAAANKVYDSTRDASVSGSLRNVIEGDNVFLDGLHGQFDTKHVGNDKPVTVTYGNLGGRDADNYVFRPDGELRTYADITPLRVTGGAFTAMDKVYDGTRNAQVTGTLSGILPGDDVEIDRFTGLFDTKNVGNDKTVTISASGAAGRDVGNYIIDVPLTTTASITPREAQIEISSEVAKIYDGSNAASLGAGQYSLSGILASDAVTVTGPTQGVYDNRNVGQQKTVTVNGPFVIAGADAINYSYGGAVLDGSGANSITTTASTDVGRITARELILTGVQAHDKMYDRNTDAHLSDGKLSGVIGNDSVSIGTLTGQFATPDAGTGKEVLVSASGLTGADAGNYTLAPSSLRATANIDQRTLNLQILSGQSKVYDGTPDIEVDADLAGVLAGDTVQLGSLSGRFDDKNVGDNKLITLTNLGNILLGPHAHNYTVDANGTLRGRIDPRPAQISIDGTINKVYDGSPGAALGAGQYTLAGILGNDLVRVTGPTQGQYDSANAGTRTVTVTGPFDLTGADAGNYSYGGVRLNGNGTNTITTSASGIGNIDRRTLTLSNPRANNKVYDGTMNASVDVDLSNVVGRDQVSLGSRSGAFDSKHAGDNKRVTITVGGLQGQDAHNYQLPVASTTTTASISKLTLSTDGIRANDKVYDGNDTAILTGAPTGVLANDQVTIAPLAGRFDNKNAGTGKTVLITGGALSGLDAGNYQLDNTPPITAAITPRAVTLALIDEPVKEYDATNRASLGTNPYEIGNLVAGDQVVVRGPGQGSYDTPNAGEVKTVTVSGPFYFTGLDAGNYSLNGTRLSTGMSASVAGTGQITRAVLTYQANPAVVESTQPFGTLTGTVTGFKGEDNMGSATTGQLAWQAQATNGSSPGTYPIHGTGLSATNYDFVQAPANASALVVRPSQTIGDINNSVTNAALAALGGTSPVPNLPPASSPVADSTGPGAAKAFSPVRIGSMSQEELAQMLAQRRSFKQNLFSAAIYKLEMDPSLADLQPCTTVMEASSGACRISAAQLELLHAARPQAHVQEQTMGRAVAKTSNLPKIERKIAVLFGVNEYSDKAIPRLENAITDVDAIARLFDEKLGYEVRVLHNPGKAEMIRALNALATEVGSEDSVVVYYAGHGYSLEKNGAGYWLPSDAAASDPRQWISNSDVAKILSGIRSRQMALISDSCYSGAFAREGMANVGRNVNADDVLSKRSVVVLSSGGDEPVPDEGRGNHSIFAWNLMQVVGSVANWKPGSTVFEGVQEAVRKEFPQTPQYGALTAAGHQTGGDYLFEFRSR
nr:YDG domain-containing protein [Massilia sp. MS-15]